MNIILERGLSWGYLPDPDKPLFIVNTHNQEEVARQEVEVKSP